MKSILLTVLGLLILWLQPVHTNAQSVSVPTGLVAEAQGSTGIKLTWTNGAGSTPTDYQIERGENAGGPFNLLQTIAYSRTPTFTDNGVLGGKQYCYRVRARIGATSSAYSNVACATTRLSPSNVANLNATTTGTRSIRLSWTPFGKESGIDIERRTGQSGNWSKIASTLGDGGQYTDNNLSPNTEYCYRIIESTHEPSAVVCATTQQERPATPAAPARLAAQSAGPNQINLQWADQSDNETGFVLERAGQPGGPFQKVADIGRNATGFEDKNLNPNTQYCYRIEARNEAGGSGFSNTACATTAPPPGPNAPARLTATAVSPSQINLAWADGSDNETGFQLERSTDGNTWDKIADLPANTTAYENTGLNPSTRYLYRLRAVNANGVSGYSNTAEATTQDKPLTPPAAPNRLAATAVSASQINLSWNDASDNESGFEVERSPDGSSNWTKVGDAPANATSFANTGLNPTTRYFYRLRAINSAGSSGYSNTADATTPDVPPAAPARLTATAASATSVALTWADASGNETGFEIERGSSETGAFTKLADVGANATTYTDQGLTPGQPYCYRVRAKNAVGASAFSNIACATTPDVPPAAPTRLTATPASPTQINLDWADGSTNESGFEVERAASATGAFQKIADLPANTVRYEDKNLADNTTYCYRVRAKNAAGPSAYTEAVCTKTPLAPPVAPQNLTAQLSDFDQVRLNWPPVSANAVLVRIERSTNPVSGFTEISQQPAAQTGYLDVGLQEFTTYYYRIRADNAAGLSGYSNIASARVEEIIIGVDDDLFLATSLTVSQRTLTVATTWATAAQTTVRLMTPSGQTLLVDSRRVAPVDTWSYSLDRLSSGIYFVILAADGRSLTKRILVP